MRAAIVEMLSVHFDDAEGVAMEREDLKLLDFAEPLPRGSY